MLPGKLNKIENSIGHFWSIKSGIFHQKCPSTSYCCTVNIFYVYEWSTFIKEVIVQHNSSKLPILCYRCVASYMHNLWSFINLTYKTCQNLELNWDGENEAFLIDFHFNCMDFINCLNFFQPLQFHLTISIKFFCVYQVSFSIQ